MRTMKEGAYVKFQSVQPYDVTMRIDQVWKGRGVGPTVVLRFNDVEDDGLRSGNFNPFSESHNWLVFARRQNDGTYAAFDASPAPDGFNSALLTGEVSPSHLLTDAPAF